MEIKAKVAAVCPLEEKNGKNGAYKVAVVIVEYIDGDYPRKVALTNIKNAESFSRIPVGSTGTFNINLNSREYQSRWYTTCDCWQWRLDNNTGKGIYDNPPTVQQRAQGTVQTQPQPQTSPISTAPQAAASDDLPF